MQSVGRHGRQERVSDRLSPTDNRPSDTLSSFHADRALRSRHNTEVRQTFNGMDVPASAPSNRRSFLILTASRPRTGYRLQTCGASARRVTAISTKGDSHQHEGSQYPIRRVADAGTAAESGAPGAFPSLSRISQGADDRLIRKAFPGQRQNPSCTSAHVEGLPPHAHGPGRRLSILYRRVPARSKRYTARRRPWLFILHASH